MATALIGGVAMGSTVRLNSYSSSTAFQAELRPGPTDKAIEAAVRGVGDGILITTGILAGGFLCMTVSKALSRPADFGIFTCFTIVTGAFLEPVIDPILLGFMAPRGGQAAGPTPALASLLAVLCPSAVPRLRVGANEIIETVDPERVAIDTYAARCGTWAD